MSRSTGPRASAVLCVWNDIDAEIEGEYEAWYQRDHLRDRVSVPGFRNCRRHLRVAGDGPQYFTLYELDSVDVMRSEAYAERLRKPTEWTRRLMPHFRHAIRVAAHVRTDRGDGTGGHVATAGFEHLTVAQATAARAAVESHLDATMADARLTRVRVFEADAQASGGPNPEAALRPDAPRIAELSLAVEASYEATARDHLARLMALPALADLTPTMVPAVYRLLFSTAN